MKKYTKHAMLIQDPLYGEIIIAADNLEDLESFVNLRRLTKSKVDVEKTEIVDITKHETKTT
jgi:hypothetical protein